MSSPRPQQLADAYPASSVWSCVPAVEHPAHPAEQVLERRDAGPRQGTRSWHVLTSVAQGMLVLAAVGTVLNGAAAPLATATAAATALVLIICATLADRERFQAQAADVAPRVVAFYAPAMVPAPAPAPAMAIVPSPVRQIQTAEYDLLHVGMVEVT